MHLIKIHNLNYQVEGFFLRCKEIQIAFKDMVVFSGSSGSGKSTLLRILLGLESGGPNFCWTFDGEVFSQLPLSQKRIGVVFQDYALFPHLSCRDNISYPQGVTKERVDQIIKELNLEACQNRKAFLLSGGEKQRTALGRALAYNPRLLFLDEPFSALDETTKKLARDRLYQDLKKFKVPAILVTHDPRDYENQKVTLLKFNQGSFFVEESHF